MKEKIFKNRLVKFALVGSVGFIVEAVLISYLSTYQDIDPLYGRLVSFPIAVFVTWLMNRKVTFKSHNSPRTESLKYYIVQTFGALCNLCIFLILIFSFKFLEQKPVIPLAVASILVLPINFILSRSWVYRSSGS